MERIEEMRIENEKITLRLAAMAEMAIRALDVVIPMLEKIQPRLARFDRLLSYERRQLAAEAAAALKQATRIMDGKEDDPRGC